MNINKNLQSRTSLTIPIIQMSDQHNCSQQNKKLPRIEADSQTTRYGGRIAKLGPTNTT